MNPITTLEKTSSNIVYSLPLGKPNPNSLAKKDVEDRDRVAQTVKKSFSSIYDACNYVRRRIGKNFEKELEEQRQIEKLGSNWRKAHLVAVNKFPLVTTLNTEYQNKFFSSIDQTAARWLLNPTKECPNWEGSVEFSSALSEFLTHCAPTFNISELVFGEFGGRPSLAHFLKDFLNENKYKNVHEFLSHKGSLLSQTDINLIKNIYLNSQNILQEIQEIDDPTTKWHRYREVAQHCLAMAYGLKETKWTPEQNIDSLIKELTEHGPLVIGGEFGKDYYIDSPTKIEIIHGKEACSWKPGAPRRKGVIQQYVVLVGAKKVKDMGLVYFIDPTEASDPKNPSSQKYYKISYTNLKNHIESTGILSSHSTDGKMPNYGYHGNFKLT